MYKTHHNFSRTNKRKQKKKKSTNTKPDKIYMMNIINVNNFNLHNRLVNNDTRYMKVTLSHEDLPGSLIQQTIENCKPTYDV